MPKREGIDLARSRGDPDISERGNCDPDPATAIGPEYLELPAR